MSKMDHLNRLSAVRSMRAVRQLHPAAFPGSHCPMHTALSLAVSISGISTLVIGMPECSYYSRNIPEYRTTAPNVFHWTYILDSREIVFGCRQGVSSAIKEMSGAGAEVILMLSTCVPDVIGEDFSSLCTELQPGISARLLYVSLGNFKCGGYEPGNWKTLLALYPLMDAPSANHGQLSVNVMGRDKKDAHSAMPHLLIFLEAMGIHLHFLAKDASLEDYRMAGHACLNLILSPFFDPLAEKMELEDAVPAVSLHALYSADDIQKAYRRIGKILDQQGALDLSFENAIEDYFSGNYQNLREQETTFREACIRPLRYISAVIGAVQPLPLNLYMSMLGMEPVMIHMEEFYPSDMTWKKLLIQQGIDPLICLMLNEAADWEVILEEKPDFVLSDRNFADGDSGTPASVRVSDLYGEIGYERSCSLLKRLQNIAVREKKGS